MKKNVLFGLLLIMMVFCFIGCDIFDERPALIDWPSNWIGHYKHSDNNLEIEIDKMTISILTNRSMHIHRSPTAPGWCYLNSIDETSFTLVRRIDEFYFEPIIGPVMYTINEYIEDGNIQSFTTDRDIDTSYFMMPHGTYTRID
jgi:hypothetical protein